MDFFNIPGGDKYAKAHKPNIIRKTVVKKVVRPPTSSASASSSKPVDKSRPLSSSASRPSSSTLSSRYRPPTARSSATPSEESPKKVSARRTEASRSSRATSWPRTPTKRRRPVSSSSGSSDSETDKEITRTPKRNRTAGAGWDDVGEIKPRNRLRSSVLNAEALMPDAETTTTTTAFIHSADVVRNNLAKYRPYFTSDDTEDVPEVELVYPARGFRERFALLQPRHSNEYHPIQEILNSIGLMVDHFVPDSHMQRFKLQPTDFFSSKPPAASVPASPAASNPGTPSGSTPALSATDPILRSLLKSYNRKDLAGFVHAIKRFNEEFEAIRQSGEVASNAKIEGEEISGERWRELVSSLGECCYQRTVGPGTTSLSEYEPFSDYVYGELLPRFVFTIADRADLKHDSCFVDLGSGVGNCLGNIALYTGSSSIGCEYMPNPSRLARLQIGEIKVRWQMWAVKGNQECEAIEGDFCSDSTVIKALQKADLVLVNNYAFTPALNDRLSLLFLELKDGTRIISLKPFLPDNFRLNDRTASSPSAILRMRELPYPAGSVSWTDVGGVYYEHVVDRSLLRAFYENGARRTSRR